MGHFPVRYVSHYQRVPAERARVSPWSREMRPVHCNGDEMGRVLPAIRSSAMEETHRQDVFVTIDVSSGNETWLAGKSPMNVGFLTGKSPMNGPFSSAPCLMKPESKWVGSVGCGYWKAEFCRKAEFSKSLGRWIYHCFSL